MVAALLLLAGGWLARDQLLPPLASWLDVGEPPQHVDYAMVLPGDLNTRPFVAAALYRAGLADRVLIPVTTTDPDVEDGISLPHDEILRQVLLCRGVPEDRIEILPGHSDSTWNDAQALGRFLAACPSATRVAVVTSDYHTRRARWVFRRSVPEFRGQIHFVSAPSDHFDPTRWWYCREGALQITGEYVKFAIYLAGDPWTLAIVGAVVLVVLGLAIAKRRVKRSLSL